MIETYEQFSARLEESYPKMFTYPYGGVAVSQGWYHIIESLCKNIDSYINWKYQQHTRSITQNEKVIQPAVPQVVVTQIKEKFGGLRFYYDGGDEHVSGMVRMAESWADHTCEMCGAPGKLRRGGWLTTLCDEHSLERDKEYESRNRTV